MHLAPVAPIQDEATLVERAQAGDQSAWVALYRIHSPRVARVAYRLLGSDGDLDDVVQDTFVEGFRGLRRLDDPSKLGAFLVTIAARRVRRTFTARYRLRAIVGLVVGHGQVKSPRRGGAPEQIADIAAVLRKVDPRHRLAWILNRVEGFPLSEVAEHCDISLATAKRWVTGVNRVMLEADDGSR